MEKGIKIYFDKEADVLYFSRGAPRSDAISRELGDDVIVRLEPQTDRVLGFTVLNFTKRFERISFTQEIPIEAELALI
jgi:uncharacterized protein YuzE